MRRLVKHKLQQLQKKYFSITGGSCAVLLYHRITSLDTDPQLLSVTPANFDKQLTWLSKHHAVLTIDELHYHLTNRKKLPQRSVAITFDDGYADNYHEALPILENHGMQALFYIATGTLNTGNEFWWDAVERILLHNDNQPAESDFAIGRHQFNLIDNTRHQRWNMYHTMLPVLRSMNSEKRNGIIAQLAAIYNSTTPRPAHRAMTFDELKKHAASNAAVIGAHTHLHPSLAALTYAEQLHEIKTSKEILEKVLERRIVHFSFPFGTKMDYNNETINICSELGFEMTAANYPFIVTSVTDKRHFPRFLVRNWDVEEFKAAINSFFI